MDSMIVQGGKRLQGEVLIQGSKNAVLPLMAAALLIEGVTVLENCPHISDVEHMASLLRLAGCKVVWEDSRLQIDAEEVRETEFLNEHVTGIRSSITILGAMLGRVGKIKMEYPGGCVIGQRPIDFHIMALKRLGVRVQEEEETLSAACESLQGNWIHFAFPSVGATENALLAAVLAKGTTYLYNCAMEPEVMALCHFLNAAGGKIVKVGAACLEIEGVSHLHSIVYKVEADRIVAGTYLCGILGAGGEGYLKEAPWKQMKAVIEVCEAMGGVVETEKTGIRVSRKGRLKPLSYLETKVYPGFPTDLQSPLLAVMTQAEGVSRLRETIFGNRFRFAGELKRMGADIMVDAGETACVRGRSVLQGAVVEAEELRGGAALVLAGLFALGKTEINGCGYIRRGYENIAGDLRSLGAVIEEPKP